MDVETTPDLVSKTYSIMAERIKEYRKITARPLTLAEKIMAGHFTEKPKSIPKNGFDYIFLRPDRVALQDVTGQMVMLQFMLAEMKQTSLPTTVHCDHLIRAVTEGESDTKISLDENSEVFLFLESSASKYGCGFWKPGAGIIHQVVLENYAFPGGLLIGTDSHTPNAGGLGMMAVGVGGVDAAETMAGMPWEIMYPKLIGVKLVGKSNGWTSPKDVILKVAGELGVYGTNSIVEYFGPGASSLSCTGKAKYATWVQSTCIANLTGFIKDIFKEYRCSSERMHRATKIFFLTFSMTSFGEVHPLDFPTSFADYAD